MTRRAATSGITLTEADAPLVKGMLARGDRQHDITAYFGVNGGRIAEVANGAKFKNAKAAPEEFLPPPGPYPCGRDTQVALEALSAARKALQAAESLVRRHYSG
jgi:hypothetical protein